MSEQAKTERTDTTGAPNPTCTAALNYARQGWPVFPCNPKDKKPLTKHGFKDASTEEPTITAWWSRWPNAMIGVPMGQRSGVWAVDPDVPAKPGEPNGLAAWQSLAAENGVPQTRTHDTPSGGKHVLFRWDPNRPVTNSTGNLPKGIDVRGEGGYVVVPPSRLADGRAYQANGCDPIAEAPAWLYARLLVRKPKTNGMAPPTRDVPEPADPAFIAKMAALNAAMLADAGKGVSTRPEDNLPPATRERIEAALAVISSDCGYRPWFEITAAVRRELGDEGRGLWEAWSRRSSKFRSSDDQKWDDVADITRFGMGTIAHYADEADPSWRDRVKGEPAASSGAREECKDARTEQKDPPPSGKSSVLVRASDVKMRAKRWLWQGHLLRGAQELLTGLPGLGKSQVQCHYVACATAGLQWPNGDPGIEPVSVIMITAEDTLDQEVVPRLIAAGADLNRVHILKCIKLDQKLHRQFLLAEDLDELARIVKRIGDVGLVAIDPITAYMGGRMDSHKATEVRSQLGPLKDFAETHDVAVSTITHPAKNAGQRAIDHFIGSQAFIAAGRIGHVCVEEMREDEAEEKMVPTGRVLFAHAKHNASTKMPTLAYRISALVVGRDEESGANIDAPRVTWEEGPDITADEAVNIAKKKDSPQTKVQNFLKQILASGNPVAQKHIVEEAKQRHGFTEKQLRTAKGKLGVVSEKEFGGWTWQLPPAPAR